MKAGDILLINCKRCIALEIMEDTVLGLEIRTGKKLNDSIDKIRFLKILDQADYIQAYENATEDDRRVKLKPITGRCDRWADEGAILRPTSQNPNV